MKRLKLIALAILMTLTPFLLQSCLDDNEPEYPWVAIRTIRTSGNIDNG